MEDMDLYLKIPASLHFKIMDKVLIVIGEVDIGLRPATPPPINQVIMVDYFVYLLLLVMFMKFFMKMKAVILVVMMEDVYLGLKRPATLPFSITGKVLMVMVELDIGLIPAPIPPTIQVSLVGRWVFLFVVMR